MLRRNWLVPLHCLLHWLLRFLRAGFPEGRTLVDGVAWGIRMVLIGTHLCFALPALYRPNIPLFLPSYAAFDDAVPFTYWGWAGLSAALLLWVLPPRVPWGILSTSISAFYLYFLAAMFWQGVGFVSGVMIYAMMGLFSGALLMRALWAYAQEWPWFRHHILKDYSHG